MNGALTLLPITFSMAILLGVSIFLAGRRSMNKLNTYRNGGEYTKLTPYSCGEHLVHDVQSRINLERFLLYAVYFLIFDVAAFILAISFNLLALSVLVYALIMLSSVILVVKR